MSLALDVIMSETGATAPVLELVGPDAISVGLLRHVKIDIEMPADDGGNAYFQIRLPDRKMVVALSAPLPGELFFTLERLFEGTPKRPVLRLRNRDEVEDLTDAVAWSLLDFSGAWMQAVAFGREERWDEAITKAEEALSANTASEGFRIVLGRFYLEAGRYDDARRVFEDERGRFPHSYRALCELAALAYRTVKRREAIALLEEALALYPNHLQSLLLVSDLRMAGGRSDVVETLARAWRLTGSLNPSHVLAILERRQWESLLPKIRVAARAITLEGAGSSEPERDTPVQDQAATGADGDDPDVPTPEETQAVLEDSRAVNPPASKATAEVPSESPSDVDPGTMPKVDTVSCPEVAALDVVRLTAREVLRDGKVTPEEQMVFRRICAHFKVSKAAVGKIVAEEETNMRDRGLSAGSFDGPRLLKGILELVFADKVVSRAEAGLVVSLSTVLGLSRSEVQKIRDEVIGHSSANGN